MEAHDVRARVLDRLQGDLEAIYRVEAPLPASSCALDRESWVRMSGSGAPEELLVVQDDDGLRVGLYVDDAVFRDIEGDPSRWTHRRLSAHCSAVEGVSHFVYFTLRASVPRPVSQLELELQAEVDKFATVVLTLWESGRRDASEELLERLFERVSYREGLSAETLARYEKANSLARLYCRFLHAEYVARNRVEGFLADLRRFYRLGAADKLSHAACGAAY